MKKALALYLISFGWLLPRLCAGEHPVPLEPNTDPASCVQCHEEKTKNKAVHSAMASGCTTCHEIKNVKDTTQVNLTAPSVTALCVQCHAEKDPAKGHTHPVPAAGCTACHDPHSSPYKNQLKKPLSGVKGEDLCLSCHDKGVKPPEKGSRHAALDMGCNTCHEVHKVGDPAKNEFAFHLKKPAPALCIDCHDATAKELATAHHDQPFAQADCSGCHDAHQSSSAKLINPVVHATFDSCEACHQAAKDGKVVVNEEGKRALCYTCHDNIREQIDKAKVPHPGVQEFCTDCHTPHASRQAKLLKASATQVCGGCHELPAQPVRHGPYAQGRCAECHTPHGGSNAKLLRAEGNTLCRGCHVDGEKDVTIDAAQSTVTLPWKTVLTSQEYDAATKIGLDAGNRTGHPLFGHPISGKSPRLNREISCLSCHQPHSSTMAFLMPAGLKNELEICDQCHGKKGK